MGCTFDKRFRMLCIKHSKYWKIKLTNKSSKIRRKPLNETFCKRYDEQKNEKRS